MSEPAPSVVRCVAVIPARGDSRSVPRKNLRPLAGRPLIAHAIGQALLARWVGRVVVATDDLEVAAVAGRFGAEVALMPTPVRVGDSFSEVALGHALASLAEQGERPDVVVMVQPGAPLTSAEDIDGTIRTLVDEGADSCFAAAPCHHFLWQRFADGQAIGINHTTVRRPRHREMDPQYIEAGAVYAMVADGFLAARHRFFGRTVLHVMPAEGCLQIREPLDLVKAEAILRSQGQIAALAALAGRPAALVLDGQAFRPGSRARAGAAGDEDEPCSRCGDLGLEPLRRSRLPVIVIARAVDAGMVARCSRSGIDCIRSLGAKLPVLEAWAQVNGIGLEQVVYLGSGADDVAPLQAVGCGVTHADAPADVRAAARVVLEVPAGRPAVRAVADLIVKALETGALEPGREAGVRYGT